jgi:beta-mannanase
MTSSVPMSTARLRFGVSTPGGASANNELDAVASMLGENPSIVLSYQDFAQAAPIAALNSVNARGAISLLTWEPWRWGGGGTQPAYSSARIIAGDFDLYLKQWGVALAAWGKPVMLRYAHEMNGNWYPWADGVNGNQPGSYVAAWRHVHDVLLAQGATNVIWVWSPNIPYSGSTALSAVYPGSAYADIVAFDGYNWGTTMASGWRSPSTLFGAGLTQLRALAPGKEILIAETGSAEIGGSKADWITALVSYLAAQSDVTGFVWFDQNKGADWRIDTSADSVAALKAALLARNP